MRPTRWTRAGAALAAQGRLLAYGLGELGARPRRAERFSIAYNIRRLPPFRERLELAEFDWLPFSCSLSFVMRVSDGCGPMHRVVVQFLGLVYGCFFSR